MLKVHNGWSLAAAVLIVILISNALVQGSVTNTFFKNTYKFITDTIKALEVGSGYGKG